VRRPTADALVFGNVDGSPISPRKLSRECLRTCEALGLPRVMSHALRHTHASALIAAGLDMVVISRRLGHANPTVALNIYGHLSIGPTRGSRRHRDHSRNANGTVVHGVRCQSGANFGFSGTWRFAKCLISLSGWVAEWFKAPVLKAALHRSGRSHRVTFHPLFRCFCDRSSAGRPPSSHPVPCSPVAIPVATLPIGSVRRRHPSPRFCTPVLRGGKVSRGPNLLRHPALDEI